MSRRNTNTLTESGSGQFPADTGIGPKDSVSRRYSTFVVSPPSSDAEELEEGEEYEDEEEEEEEEIHQEQEMQENIFHTISGPRGEDDNDARVKLPSNDDTEFVLTPVLPRSQDQSIDPDTPETFTVESPAAISTDRQALDKVKEETTSPEEEGRRAAEQQATQTEKEVEQQHRSTLAGQGLLSSNKVPHQQQQQQHQKTAAATGEQKQGEETNDTPPQPYRAKVTLLTDAEDREAEDDDEPTSFSMGGGTSMATLSIDAKVTELLMVLFSKSRQSSQSVPTANNKDKKKKKKAKKEKKQPTNDSPCMETMYDSGSAEEECGKKINDNHNNSHTDSSSVFDDDDDTSSINSIGDAERHAESNTAEHKRFLLQASGLTHAELMDLAPLTSWLMPGAHDDSADLLAILRSIAASTQEDIEGGNDYYGNPAIDEAAGNLLTKEDSLELSRKTVAAQKAHLDKMEEESASESNAKITAEAKEELRSMLRREHASRRAEKGGDQAKMNDDELSPTRRYDENEKVMDALFAVRVAFHRVEVAKSLRRPQLSKVGGNKTDNDDDEMARHIKESKARQKRLEELVTTQFNRAVEQAMRVILEARRQNLALAAASAQ